MKKTLKEKRDEEFIKKHTGKHFCHCPCKGEIVILPYHRYTNVPDYINGHVGKTKKSKKRFTKWSKEFQNIPKVKKKFSEWTKEYNNKIEVKELRRKYNNEPKIKKANIKFNIMYQNLPEVKRRLRISAIKQIEKQFNNGQPVIPFIGKNETQILDRIEIQRNIKIIRQYKVIGYFLDGYCKELNIAFEIDETAHFDIHSNLRQKDIERQKEIEKELGCEFIRIKDNFITHIQNGASICLVDT